MRVTLIAKSIESRSWELLEAILSRSPDRLDAPADRREHTFPLLFLPAFVSPPHMIPLNPSSSTNNPPSLIRYSRVYRPVRHQPPVARPD